MRSKARFWALKNCPCSSRLKFFLLSSINFHSLGPQTHLSPLSIHLSDGKFFNQYFMCLILQKVFISKKIMIFHTSYSFFNNLFVYDTLQIMKVLLSTFIFHLSMKSIIKKLLNLEKIILLAL